MGWDRRIASAARLVCQAALMSEPTVFVGSLATLRHVDVDVVAPGVAAAGDAQVRQQVSTPIAARSAVASPSLAWR
jgi:hypothetical protein